MPQHAKISVKP